VLTGHYDLKFHVRKKRKFRKACKAAGMILRNPVLLNRVMSSPDIWEEYVVREYDRGKGLPVIRLNQIHERDYHEVGPITFLDGGSLPTDLALLRLMASFYKDCKYFEIGTWRGESVANMARVASECYTLNLSADEMRKMGVRSRYIYMMGYFSRALDNVVHLTGNSMDFDFEGMNKRFDVIFIDGGHHYEEVRNDTEKVFRYLAHEDSIVVWHDYAYHPEKIRYEVMAGILDGTDPEIHDQIYHVSQTKCAVYMNKKLQGRFLDPPEEPEEYFEIKLNRKPIQSR
jgi:predicted O-methyltransferase YrrM